MADSDYASRSKFQRLAVFLIVVGPESAAEVLRHFEDGDLDQLCREMGQIAAVSPAMRAAALAEFAPVIGESAGLTLGGADYARRTLGLVHGEHKAELMFNRLNSGEDAPAPVATGLVAELAEMEGRQIYNMIREEQPQTIAFLLSYLGPEKSAEIFMFLGPELREDVIERIGTIETTPRDLVDKIVRNLTRHLTGRVTPAYYASGGVRAVADLLKNIDKENSKALLARMEERNATLGAAVRRKMFRFEDIRILSASDLQRVLREVDSSHLATAMKSAPDALRDTIYASMSKRAAESLRDEISMLGPVRLKDVETAQDAVIVVVRRLEEEGVITVDGGDSAMVA